LAQPSTPPEQVSRSSPAAATGTWILAGSLAWVLWIRAARSAGAPPPVRRTTFTGLVAAPVAIVGAVIALELVGGKT
jgi:hypothetical protein